MNPGPLATLDAKLYVLRRMIEKAALESEARRRRAFYICSLDRRRIVYKGLLTCEQLRLYFPDLSDERVQNELSLWCIRVSSTNTLGAWHLAHPYRCTVHNGEINTLRGNLNRMKTREAVLASPVFGADIEQHQAGDFEGTSDTAVLDNVLELLLESGPQPCRMRCACWFPRRGNKDRHMDPSAAPFTISTPRSWSRGTARRS